MKQPAHTPPPAREDYLRATNRQCPLCAAYLVRTPRRPVDRLWSIFRPARRYRCERFACQWHGNFPLQAKDGTAEDGRSGAVKGTVPAAFVAHILVAVAGAILVVVIGNSEPPVLLDAFSLEPGDSQVTSTTAAQEERHGARQIHLVTEPGKVASTIRPASRY